MKEKLASEIEKIKNDRSMLLLDEAAIKTGIVLRLLSTLGWNPFDVDEVRPEYTVETKRVDFSLRINGINKVFVEVKRPNENLELHQKQLLEYSFREGIRLAILTNGITWWFYLPLNEGSWEQRRFFTADFSEQKAIIIAERFFDLLSKQDVASGDSIKNAERLIITRQKETILKDSIPKAWHKIITDPDELLVELLMETTEKISGFQPEIKDIEAFLKNTSLEVKPKSELVLKPTNARIVSSVHQISSGDDYINKRLQDFSLLGKVYHPHTWKELLITVSEEMYRRHPDVFDQCLTLRGSKMVYFSLNKDELSLPVQISDSKYFVETKFSSNSIVRRSRDLMSLFGYKANDLNVTAV